MTLVSPNNSPVYWDLQTADADTDEWFSLHTYAWSVKSFGGRRFFAPPKRGEDLLMPFRRGRLHMPKSRELQTYDINMWIFPTNEDGSKDVTKTVEQKAHENWRKIVSTVDQEGQFYLRKRWYPDDAVKEDFYTDVVTATALAEFIDGDGPDSDDGHGYYANLTFILTDPYFYSSVNTISLPSSTNTISLQGEAPTDHLLLEIVNAGATNPKITFPDGNWIQFLSGDPTNSGHQNDAIVIDFRKGLAVRDTLSNYLNPSWSATGKTFVNGLIRRNPAFVGWPILDPGKYPSSDIARTGTATISLKYDAAYR